MRPQPGSVAGKVCVVTGATSGIGEVTARELTRLGGSVVVVGRSADRCEATLARIRAIVPTGQVRSIQADLSQMAEVRRLAQTLQQDPGRVDVLVNNAGGVFFEHGLTIEGNERTMALNVLAPFLLTRLLEPTLRADQPARVVNVASAAHNGVKLDFDDLEGNRGYRGYRMYSRSKLALILLTHEFARRWSGSGVTVNALHPGFVRTRFGHNNPGPSGWTIAFFERIAAISPERGADTVVYLASAPGLESTTGEYFIRRRPHRSSAASYDTDAARRLWEFASLRTQLPP
jgi:NAD(P)-dependent dehydrogenase (short-subunit alcohol dehydrogenase family)